MNEIDGFKISLVLLVFVSFVCFSQANTVSFQGLGDLPGGGFWSNAVGVSADGSVVVGFSDSSASDIGEAFRWENGVMTGLGYPAGRRLSEQGVGRLGRRLGCGGIQRLGLGQRGVYLGRRQRDAESQRSAGKQLRSRPDRLGITWGR